MFLAKHTPGQITQQLEQELTIPCAAYSGQLSTSFQVLIELHTGKRMDGCAKFQLCPLTYAYKYGRRIMPENALMLSCVAFSSADATAARETSEYPGVQESMQEPQKGLSSGVADCRYHALRPRLLDERNSSTTYLKAIQRSVRQLSNLSALSLKHWRQTQSSQSGGPAPLGPENPTLRVPIRKRVGTNGIGHPMLEGQERQMATFKTGSELCMLWGLQAYNIAPKT